MSRTERFYDLMFEVSNEYRHQIMLMLKEQAMRVTALSNELDLTTPEVSRHISRLCEIELAVKDVEGFFHLTPFGTMVLTMLQEFEFTSKHSAYFSTHLNAGLPAEFTKRIGDLSESGFSDNILDFIRQIEHVIKDSKEYVWLLCDQFPLNHLSLIIEAIERGVQFRIIEPRDRILSPDIEAIASEENLELSLTKLNRIIEQRMLDEINVFMYLSEKSCVSAFPTLRGENEYKGFISKDETSLRWFREVFLHYWEEAEPRTPTPSPVQVKRGQISEITGSTNSIVVVGRDRSEYDAQAIQDALDNYEEVILKGRFNLGTSTIYINRSVVLRGEGRKDDIPDTKIYKKGWTFPFIIEDFLLVVRGDGIDVLIENIHIEDFNGTCIRNQQGHSVTIRKNRLTLRSGLGRGLSFGNWGDHVVGIQSGGESMFQGSFPGGVLIEDNFLDFAISYERGGFISNKGLENDPSYRPDLQKHENSICIGIYASRNLGKVIIRNNVVRNMTSRGILVNDNWGSSDITIENNSIISEVFGVYPYNNPMSGVGILLQSAWSEPRSRGRVEVNGNKIVCDKVNYCGIAVYGPAMYQKGAGKLEECIIKNNEIELGNGSIGALVRRSDHTEIIDNKISGKAYYGLQIQGSPDRQEIDLGAKYNIFEDNDM
ncbi:MAG: ArsR family transcriptional regulator [Candidatus Bathyarchaeota archaeon]|nr:ArsR family transcriptional regulator [Candidatus Bathyarchaeota archaeon]